MRKNRVCRSLCGVGFSLRSDVLSSPLRLSSSPDFASRRAQPVPWRYRRATIWPRPSGPGTQPGTKKEWLESAGPASSGAAHPGLSRSSNGSGLALFPSAAFHLKNISLEPRRATSRESPESRPVTPPPNFNPCIFNRGMLQGGPKIKKENCAQAQFSTPQCYHISIFCQASSRLSSKTLVAHSYNIT